MTWWTRYKESVFEWHKLLSKNLHNDNRSEQPKSAIFGEIKSIAIDSKIVEWK